MKKLFLLLLTVVFFAACDSSDSGSGTQETPSISFPGVTDSLDISSGTPASLEVSLTFPSGTDTSEYTVTLSGFDAAQLNIPENAKSVQGQGGSLFFDISAVEGASGSGEITVTVTDASGEVVIEKTLNYTVQQPLLYFKKGAETLNIVYGEEEIVEVCLVSSGKGVPYKIVEFSDPSVLLDITEVKDFTDSDGCASFKVTPKADAPKADASLILTASVNKVFGASVEAAPLRYAVIPTSPVFTFNVPELYLDFGATVPLEVALKRTGIALSGVEIKLSDPSGLLNASSPTVTTDVDGKAVFNVSALNDADASGVLKFSASAEGSPKVTEDFNCFVLAETVHSVEIRVALMDGLGGADAKANNSGLAAGSGFSIGAVNTASLYDGGLLLSAESGEIKFEFDNDIAKLPANTYKKNIPMTVDGAPNTVKLLLVVADGSSQEMAIPIRNRKALEAIDYHTGTDVDAAGYFNLNRHYTLENDIDLVGGDWTTPIGYASASTSDVAPFTGTFNGRGYKITNFNITNSSEALFHIIKGVGAEVSHLHISGNLTISGAFLATYLRDGASAHHVSAAGTITGISGSGLIHNIGGGTLTNCFSDVSSTLTNGYASALIVSTVYDASPYEAYVKNCYSTGDSYFGNGIANAIYGYGLDAYVENTYATGTLGRKVDPVAYNTGRIAGIANVSTGATAYLRNSVALNEAIYSTGTRDAEICRVATTSTTNIGTALVNNYAYDGMTLKYGANAANTKSITPSLNGNEGADIAKSGLTKSFFMGTLGWSEDDWDMDWATDSSRTWKLPIIKGHMEEYQKARTMPAHLQ
jgi:hypothetical protein